jgi:hypothetical protein
LLLLLLLLLLLVAVTRSRAILLALQSSPSFKAIVRVVVFFLPHLLALPHLLLYMSHRPPEISAAPHGALLLLLHLVRCASVFLVLCRTVRATL